MERKNCSVCQKEIVKNCRCSRKEWENKKFCSRKCKYSVQKGNPNWIKGNKTGFVPKTAIKKGQHLSPATQFKKGMIPWIAGQKGKLPPAWNKGKAWSYEAKKKMSEGHKMSAYKPPKGKDHWAWKDDITYGSLHHWIRREKGRADHCEQCGASETEESPRGSFEWGNISHEYKRDFTDWMQLCRPCHRKYDRQKGYDGTHSKYSALHNWVKRKLGKPQQCEHCGTTEMPKGKTRWFAWANKSREYKRDITDWIRLCRLCHEIYDKK